MKFEQKKITDRDVYEYYRKNRKKTAPGINQYNLFVKAVGALMISLKWLMLESQTGIYIEKFGYFCAIINPIATRNKCSRYMLDFKYLKKRHSYHLYFFPDEDFKRWQMQGMFAEKVKDKFQFKVNEGMEYKFMHSYITQIKNAKKESKKSRTKCRHSTSS